jgi:hypothetical protein
MSTNQKLPLDEFPGLIPDGIEHEDDDESVATGGSPPTDPDEAPYTKTYVAIDGIDAESLSQEQIDALTTEIADAVLLQCNLPASGVRVIAGDSYVVEHDA